ALATPKNVCTPTALRVAGRHPMSHLASCKELGDGGRLIRNRLRAFSNDQCCWGVLSFPADVVGVMNEDKDQVRSCALGFRIYLSRRNEGAPHAEDRPLHRPRAEGLGLSAAVRRAVRRANTAAPG